MIKANELRIGNFIKNFKNEIHCVKEIRVDYWSNKPGSFQTFSFEKSNGIPLTPEVLEKCGFDENGKLNHFKIGYDNDDFVKAQMSVQFQDTMIKVKYLHQLQNLYFALTGNELEINLSNEQ